MNIGFVGLGKLGMPCAEAMATVYKVTGYDILDKTSDKINIVPSIEEVVRGQDIIFCSGTNTPRSAIRRQ